MSKSNTEYANVSGLEIKLLFPLPCVVLIKNLGYQLNVFIAWTAWQRTCHFLATIWNKQEKISMKIVGS